jgi:hypothetical protein
LTVQIVPFKRTRSAIFSPDFTQFVTRVEQANKSIA